MLCYYRYSKQKRTVIQNRCNHSYESVDTIKIKELNLLSQFTEEMEMTGCEAYGKVTTKSNNEDGDDAAATL